MVEIGGIIQQLKAELSPFGARLVAVSKTRTAEEILPAYDAGQRIFGENYVQEIAEKRVGLPSDIEWHFIGHLQSNKVKFLAPFIHCIHTVDSMRLLKEIDKQAMKEDRIVSCLLQVHIAREETKFGMNSRETLELLNDPLLASLKHVRITGLMGMATNTTDEDLIRQEFRSLRNLFDAVKTGRPGFTELSMGMSSDYKIALQEGSTLVRIGSSIFGERDHSLSK